MGNKKNLIWYLILFTNDEKKDIFKVIKCSSIVEMGYYLDVKPQLLSNFYHKLTKPRGILNLISITQNTKI